MKNNRIFESKRNFRDLDHIGLVAKALMDWDGASLKVIGETRPDDLRLALTKVEAKIKESSETDSLKTLCRSGCQKIMVLWLLHPLLPTPMFPILEGIFNWPGPRKSEALFRRKSSEIGKIINRLRKTADEMEALNLDFEFRYLLTDGGPELRNLWDLPHSVRNYAEFVQSVARYFGKGSEGVYSIVKARFTAYVRHQTHSFHDKEVAALIGSVMDKDYSDSDHSVWRRKHYRRLESWVGPFAVANSRPVAQKR